MQRSISDRPELTLVAAMARNRVIGNQGSMPWHLPADLKHFKAVTMGHPVIMGRKTFESIGKALPGRLNVVISRAHPRFPGGVVLAAGLEEALSACTDAAKVMVIGGGEIYRQALPMATWMELTFVDAEPQGDTFFPDYPRRDWALTRMQVRPADQSNNYRLVFCRFQRQR